MKNLKTQSTQATSMEQHAIHKAMANGHLNPRDCANHQAYLWAEGADRKILEYKMIPISDIIDSNIRVVDVDPKYCKEELTPLIKEYAIKCPNTHGFMYPLLVEKSGGLYKLGGGHNRKYCALYFLGLTHVPVFVVDNSGTAIQKLVAKVRANSKKPTDGRKYKMPDAILHISNLDAAGYFNGITSDQAMRQKFTLAMKEAFPHEFTHENIRGKIYSQWQKSRKLGASTHITWDKTYEDLVLKRNKYSEKTYQDDKNRTKRHAWLSHICDTNKAIVGTFSLQGDFPSALLWKLASKWTNKTYRTAYSGYNLHIIARLTNPSVNIVDLNDQQSKHIDDFVEYNNTLLNIKNGCPIIEKIIFPARLKCQGTKDTIFSWDPKQNKFV